METKRCSRCQVGASDGFFHGRRKRARLRRRPVCVGCEQQSRDDRKRRNRWGEKARRTLKAHARKFVRAGTIKEEAELVNNFGWQVSDIAHDMEHAYGNGCTYCREPYSSMANGIADLTLDIVDPKRAPIYQTNVEFCCMTCNREKRGMTPEQWHQRKADWRAWEKQQEKIKRNDWSHLPLFGKRKAS